MTPEQQQYVQNELARGVDPEALKATLRQNNYSEDLIGQLFATTQPGAAMPVPKKGLSGLQITLIVIGVLVSITVIPIIVMSVFVASSLSDAREKGQDASYKAQVSNLRTNAVLYEDANGSYEGFCTDVISNADPDLPVLCQSQADAFQVNVELNDETYFCTDITGGNVYTRFATDRDFLFVVYEKG